MELCQLAYPTPLMSVIWKIERAVMRRLAMFLRGRGGRICAALVLLACGCLVARAVAPRVADTLTIHVSTRQSTDYPVGPKREVFAKTVSDAKTIGQVEDALDRAPRQSWNEPFMNHSCNLGGDTLYYIELRFSWHGMVVKDAKVNSESPICDTWAVTTLGVPEYPAREFESPATWQMLRQATQLPVPDWFLTH